MTLHGKVFVVESFRMFHGIWRDLVHAGRALAKARGFTLVCARVVGNRHGARHRDSVSLASTHDPAAGVKTGGLVEILTTRVGPREATDTWSYPDYADLRDANTGMTLVCWTYGQVEANKDSVKSMFVSPNYFQTIGVTLFRGPGFSATAEPAVILGYRYWQNHFASDPDIIGKTLTLNEGPYAVVGIAPAQFDGHMTGNGEMAFFIPIERHPRFRTDGADRSKELVFIHGRLMPGVSVAQASAAVSAVTSSLANSIRRRTRTGPASPLL
jgi:hypothetical protein